jgi:hypothetical protein
MAGRRRAALWQTRFLLTTQGALGGVPHVSRPKRAVTAQSCRNMPVLARFAPFAKALRVATKAKVVYMEFTHKY